MLLLQLSLGLWALILGSEGQSALIKIALDYGDGDGDGGNPNFCVDEARGCAHYGASVCFNNTRGYTGQRATTLSGHKCQRWDRQRPHRHSYPRTGRHNFCRITANETAPYCYTMDPDTPWEYCFPDCSDSCGDRWPKSECARYNRLNYCTDAKNSYFMERNCAVTCGICDPAEGKSALLLVKEIVAADREVDENESEGRWGTWSTWSGCSVTCGSGVTNRRRLCQGGNCQGPVGQRRPCNAGTCRARVTTPEPFTGGCVDEGRNCAFHGEPICRTNEYRGRRDFTASGIPCQRWDRQTPHAHNQSWVGTHAWCRNPDEEMQPWCWTTDPEVPWQYCFDIAPCLPGGCRDRHSNCPNFQSRRLCEPGIRSPILHSLWRIRKT